MSSRKDKILVSKALDEMARHTPAWGTRAILERAAKMLRERPKGKTRVSG